MYCMKGRSGVALTQFSSSSIGACKLLVCVNVRRSLVWTLCLCGGATLQLWTGGPYGTHPASGRRWKRK